MSADIKVIYNKNTDPNIIESSDSFNECQFLVIETPTLPINEGFELAVDLLINLNQGFSLAEPLRPLFNLGIKSIPLELEVFDTGYIARIPLEYTMPQFQLGLNLATQYSILIKISAIWSNCDLNAICAKQDFSNTLLTALSARQLIGDAIALAEFASNVARLFSGDFTALPGLVIPLLPDGVRGLLPGGNSPTDSIIDIPVEDIVEIFQ